MCRLVPGEQLSGVARHCNKCKAAAKKVQDSCSRLYLCVMLRSSPVVVNAVIMAVSGSRFFDVYVPQFGVDTRIQTSMMVPGPVNTHWNSASRCVPCVIPRNNICRHRDFVLGECHDV